MNEDVRFLERFRNRLKRLIEKERAACGCATQAVVRLAKKIRMSRASIYRVLNGYGDVQVKAVSDRAVIRLALGTVRLAEKFRSRRAAMTA